MSKSKKSSVLVYIHKRAEQRPSNFLGNSQQRMTKWSWVYLINDEELKQIMVQANP